MSLFVVECECLHVNRRRMGKVEAAVSGSDGHGRGGRRRSARILALEEKTRKQAQAQKAATSAASTSNPHKKRRGRKRKSLLLDMVVNSVAPVPKHHTIKEERNPKDDDASVKDGASSIKNDQPASLSSHRMPKKQTLEFILDILQRRDTEEIFAQPVDPEEVDGYYSIIKEPMDFGTLRAKLQEGMYTSLEQFQHDVFLISSNAMKFNSSTTVYYTEARAIGELAQRVFLALRTEPENFELEHSRTRRQAAKKPQSEAGSPHNKLARLAGGRAGSSLNKTSLKRPNHIRVGRPNPLIDQTNNGILSGARDGINLHSSETERRMTYMPQGSFLNGKKSVVSAVYDAPQLLTLVPKLGLQYMESLTQFVKDLGPTAQMVANKKLGKSPIETPNCLSWMPTSSSKKTDCPVPTSSALDRRGHLTGVRDVHIPHSFISISPGPYDGKMVCADGGTSDCNLRESIPTRNCLDAARAHPNNGGGNNFALMGQKAVNTSQGVGVSGSSKVKMGGTSDNTDLLVATLMQISATQNRNSQPPLGLYFPLNGKYPAQPSQLITKSQSWLQNNHAEPISLPSQTTNVAPASRATTTLPGFNFQYPNVAAAGSNSVVPSAVLDHKYGTKSPQIVQQAERIQPPPWGQEEIYDLPVMQKKVGEQIPSGKNAFMLQKPQLASTQSTPLFGTTNFLKGPNPQVQARSSSKWFLETQQSTFFDNQQPDLALQL